MFSGLSAFPLTPFAAGKPDEAAFLRLLRRLTDAKVDSLGVLGSTGSYAYLTRAQRRRIAELAVEHAEATPVMICIGAVGTDEVLALAEDAQQAGAAALLLNRRWVGRRAHAGRDGSAARVLAEGGRYEYEGCDQH
jgi:4-hydroxy-tetrahydrodipicolinate synthase